MDVVEKSFPSRLMKDRARSQAAPSGVSWPLGRPSAATLSFGLVVCLPAAPHNNRGNMQTTRTISNGQEWDCGFFTYTGLVSLRGISDDYRRRLSPALSEDCIFC